MVSQQHQFNPRTAAAHPEHKALERLHPFGTSLRGAGMSFGLLRALEAQAQVGRRNGQAFDFFVQLVSLRVFRMVNVPPAAGNKKCIAQQEEKTK